MEKANGVITIRAVVLFAASPFIGREGRNIKVRRRSAKTNRR